MSYFSDEQTKDKLLLLYFIKSSGLELSEEDLLAVQLKKRWMDYFEFAFALGELRESEFIEKVQRVSGDRIVLTPKGNEVVDEFHKRLPQSLRSDIDEYNEENRKSLQRKGENIATYKRLDDGSYEVELKVIDSETVIVDIKLNIPSSAIAKSYASKWEEKADEVFAGIISTIG